MLKLDPSRKDVQSPLTRRPLAMDVYVEWDALHVHAERVLAMFRRDMSQHVLEIPLDADACVYVETDDHSYGFQETSAVGDEIARRAENMLERVVDTIAAISRKLASSRTKFGADVPNTFTVAYGVKISAEGAIWIAKASSEAQITVTVTWIRPTP